MDIDSKSVVRELERLERLERAISDRRNQLHHDIDTLYLEAPLDTTQTARLDELEETERTVSRRRRLLHRRIDELRAEIGLPRWREQHQLGDAA